MTSCTSGFDDDATVPAKFMSTAFRARKSLLPRRSSRLLSPPAVPLNIGVCRPRPRPPLISTTRTTPQYTVRTIVRTLHYAVNELLQPIPASQPSRAWRRAAEHRHLVAANSPQLCQLQSPVRHALLSSLTSDARNMTMAIREFDLRQSAIQLQEMKQANLLKRRIFPVSAGLNGQQAMRPYEPPRTMTASPPVIGTRNPAANLLFLRIQRGVEGVEDERRRASPPPFASCAHSFHDAC
ncbi:hypothetical protein CSOJ01_13688 [Colletotrichum sojae]|uniref:Uncharacterized protein n=1 Tax=Colletotrichum sojae TaxID=2175907 RepID=A0A8H6MK99_9PEZI|nr:hypothetical protein CSOJ01_13688 [Colletotrichum sojae]